LENKYASPCFAKVPEADRYLLAKTLLLKIHIITGWTIPEEAMMLILMDQFTKKMVESYPNVNAEEMEYAFRNNTTVKDWGKAMNLSLIDEVMIPYLQKRIELSRMEESQNIKTLPPSQVSDEEFIESCKKLYMVDKNYKSIPVLCYKVLEKKINLTIDEKRKIRDKIISVAPIGANIQDLCKQYAVAKYFDGE
jgi:hypothetical protein